MRVLQDRCNCTERELTDHVSKTERCHGFTIYPRDYFYAIDWNDWLIAFEPINRDIMQRFEDATRNSFAVHFLDPLSRNQKVKLNSGCGYDNIAIEYCPKVHSLLTEDY